MNSQTQDPPDWFVKFIVMAVDVGFVWFLAWILNPDIDSGMVWLIAFLFASIQSHLSIIRMRVE